MFDNFKKVTFHPIRFRLFLLTKLPAALICGIRVRALEPGQSKISVKYRWITTNPFKSTYFACLAMAAEMSTGILAMGHLYKLKPQVSMLIVANTARYYKKATGVTFFSCTDGKEIYNTIQKALTENKRVEFTATSIGKNEAGELIAEFTFTWSFKSKVS